MNIVKGNYPLPPVFINNRMGWQPQRITAARVPVLTAYTVLLIISAFCLYIVLTIEPFSAPSAQPVRVVRWSGSSLEPETFLSDITGVDITVNFETSKPLAYTTGAADVRLSLQDSYGNITHINSEFQAYKLKNKIITEIGDDLSALTINDFVDGEVQQQDTARFNLATDLSRIDNSTVGAHNVVVLLDGIAPPQITTIVVEDNIPPAAMPVNIVRWTVDELLPDDFVKEIDDQTEVTVSFINEPDRSIEGTQPVMVLLTDEGGNTTVIASTLTQKQDTEPPEITGELKKAVCIGEAILYRAGITVTDNRDENIELMVDSSAVDPGTKGTYPVIYSAVDMSGNETTVEGSLTVYDVSYEDVEKIVTEILDGILEEGMTQLEKARAIFNFVNRRISYGSGRVYNNVHYAAYRAYKTGTGDCYAYYALSQVLLDGAGIDNIPVKRKPGYPTRHFWSLINVGDGWYHFDAVRLSRLGGFMFTDSKAAELTANARFTRGLYDYDKSLYPEVVP